MIRRFVFGLPRRDVPIRILIKAAEVFPAFYLFCEKNSKDFFVARFEPL